MEPPVTLFADNGLLNLAGNCDAPENKVPKCIGLVYLLPTLDESWSRSLSKLDISISMDRSFLSSYSLQAASYRVNV